jgi:hypothetical protein
VQGRGATTSTIRFKPVNLQAVRMVILTIITVIILAKPSTNTAGRHCVDVRNHTCVCTGHIEIKFHIATKQIERCFSGCAAISLNVPTTIADLN